MNIKKIIWSSLIDYPGKISTVLFTGSCNFNCYYCHNKELITLDNIYDKLNIFLKIINNRNIVDSIVFSGGEPTLENDIHIYCKIFYQKGLNVGIHTNGSRPDVMNKIIKYLSFVGMDIKTEFNTYNLFTNEDNIKYKIIETLKLLKKYRKTVQIEFRTTIDSSFSYLNDNYIIQITKSLKRLGFGKCTYVLQKASQDIYYNRENILFLQKKCNKYIKTILRNF